MKSREPPSSRLASRPLMPSRHRSLADVPRGSLHFDVCAIRLNTAPARRHGEGDSARGSSRVTTTARVRSIATTSGPARVAGGAIRVPTRRGPARRTACARDMEPGRHGHGEARWADRVLNGSRGSRLVPRVHGQPHLQAKGAHLPAGSARAEGTIASSASSAPVDGTSPGPPANRNGSSPAA